MWKYIRKNETWQKVASWIIVACVLQCFAHVEAEFFHDVSANSATAFLVRLCFTVRLQLGV